LVGNLSSWEGLEVILIVNHASRELGGCTVVANRPIALAGQDPRIPIISIL